MSGRPADQLNDLARRDLRLWREGIAVIEGRRRRLLDSDALRTSVYDFCNRSAVIGRRRALKRLRALLAPVAHYECVREPCEPPAAWSAIALQEDGGARVDCIVAGGRTRLVHGPWNIEATGKACRRFFERQRQGSANLSAALRFANQIAGHGRAYVLAEDDKLLLPSGHQGVFRAEIVETGDSLHERSVRVWSWVATDMLTERQRRWLRDASAALKVGDEIHPMPLSQPAMRTIDPFLSPAGFKMADVARWR